MADVFDCRSGLDGGGYVADAFDEKEAAGVTLFSLAQGAGLFDFGVGATGDDIHAAHYTVRPGCAQVGTDYTYKRRAGRSTISSTLDYAAAASGLSLRRSGARRAASILNRWAAHLKSRDNA